MADRVANRRCVNAEAEAERERRVMERREFKEAQELERLRRAFDRIDKKNDGKIDVQELMEELELLGNRVKRSEAELIIWEVDDDADGCIDWDEFQALFHRIQSDQTGLEPRKLFYIIEFIRQDKSNSGSIDLDECVTLVYARYGKETVDSNLTAVISGGGENEKNICFGKFVGIQRASSKMVNGSASTAGARLVPQVKGLSSVKDPNLAHLLLL